MNIKKEQIDFLNWEFGVFFHFGIRTFFEGTKDWMGKEMALDAFNPSGLDCGEWVKTAADAGASYAVFVCKHHDGFANWPSEYTDYSVVNTPWKGGKGDVVKEFTDACKKYGLKVGLYYSPAEHGSKDKRPKDYDNYFISQISELLADYGKIDYLWFDGCGSENHKFDKARIIKAIRGLQPDILIFGIWDPDTRWIGNESGYASMPNNNTVKHVPISIQTEEKEILTIDKFLPGECDFRMRKNNWFYSDMDWYSEPPEIDESTVKSLDELIGIYYYSVGRGANFLINIGPDRFGRLPRKDKERLLEFGKEIKRRFSKPIAAGFTSKDNVYTVEFEKPCLVNHLVLKEKLREGYAVTGYRINAYPFPYGDAIAIYESRTIGHKAICQFPTFFTSKIEVVTDGGENGAIEEASAFYVK